jgi:hypothetical protein
MTDSNGHAVLDDNYKPIRTRQYHYTVNNDEIVIQDHSAGHQFGDGGVGDQGPHFNVRPGSSPEELRNGIFPGTEAHYNYPG